MFYLQENWDIKHTQSKSYINGIDVQIIIIYNHGVLRNKNTIMLFLEILKLYFFDYYRRVRKFKRTFLIF